MHTNVDIARRYLQAIEAGATDGLAEFYHADAVQEEFPNRLLPYGAERDVAGVVEGAKRGQTVIQEQRFEVSSIMANGPHVAIEAVWTAKVSARLGTLSTGGAMRARFALFLEFQDGKIIRQRNYDCFDPF